MSTYTKEVADKLNELLEKTYDAEKGFKKAAENAEEGALKSFFEQKAKERYDFGHRLKTEINTFWEKAEGGDSMTSKAHRAWMDIKAFFSADNDEAMLEEAIRGEKAAVKEYDEVLVETSLPESTRELLINQKYTIEKGLKAIEKMEDLA